MEIRCSECGHLGAAKEVRPVDDGMGLVCAECEHVNIAMADGDEHRTADHDDADLEIEADDGEGGDDSALVESIARLLPQPGEGRRCRKCAHLFERDELEHCPRCGLSVAEGERYAQGEAPWEQPPEGKEQAYEEALQLWQVAMDESTAQTMDDFVDHVIAEGLIDFGMRRVQHHLVECPDDETALEALEQLATGLEMAIEVARTRAETKSEEFNDDVKRVRSGMMVGALIFWIGIFILFSWLFLGNV